MLRCDRVKWWTVSLAGLVLVACQAQPASPTGAPPDFGATSAPLTTVAGAPGDIFYVRPDGGDTVQCNGRIDAPYAGQGVAQACAWDHPFRALPPDGPARLPGGATLIIGQGAYRMGWGAPGAEMCEAAGAFGCLMSPIPSGPGPDQPTRILGQGWEADCAQPPELWGTGRPWFILNLTDASHVVVACLEITDHSGCVESHSGGLACERDTPPYGDWAAYGLYAEDSADILLRDLNIHGLAAGGVHAGRLRDWTVEDVRIVGNGSVGWDGDLWDDLGDANSGALIFRRWLVAWNGCGETYPAEQPVGCWGQEAGGYGDGVGMAETGGDWLIEDSAFLHNTSDGLDLLYHTLGGRVTLNRVHAEGNAGNQVKIAGYATITNSLLVGNCAFFEDQPFTYWVDHCRALGNTLALFFTGGEEAAIVNSTIYGQGDGLLAAGPREGFGCRGGETIRARNTLFLGDTDYFDSGDITFLFYQEDCGDLRLDSDYNLVFQAKNITCRETDAFTRSGSHDVCGDPQVNGPLSGPAYSLRPMVGSPALDGGAAAECPSVDIMGAPRPADDNGDGQAVCDIGAYEGP